MTEAERQVIESAIEELEGQLSIFRSTLKYLGEEHIDALETLYQAAKPVHEAALGIWTTIVNIIRAQHGLKPAGDPTDAINLDELFGKKENTCGN